MKVLFLFLASLFTSTFCLAQFSLEKEYDTSILQRVILQDKSERYVYNNADESKIYIADADHQLIDSIPYPPCNGYFQIQEIRNDIENIDMGVFCSCQDQETRVVSRYLLDEIGNEVMAFDNFISIDDHNIIQYNNESYSTKAYNTQSLELVLDRDSLYIKPLSDFYNDNPGYVGDNGKDSIYVYDEYLNLKYTLQHPLGEGTERSYVNKFSFIKNDSIKDFFTLSYYNTESKQVFTVIDANGELVYSIKSSRAYPHKHNNVVQILFQPESGLLSKYSLVDNSIKDVFLEESTGGSRSIPTNGPFIALDYSSRSKLLRGYDLNGDVSLEILIEDPYYQYGFKQFEDENGEQYYSYVNRTPDATYNTVIYKDFEYLQTIEGTNNIRVSSIPDYKTKLITFPPFRSKGIKVFGLSETTQTSDINPEISIGPNPTTDKIYVSDLDSYAQVNLYDMTNKLVTNYEINKSASYIDVSTLSNGTYILSLRSKNGITHSTKIIKTN